MTEEHIRAVLEDIDASLVREALAFFLAEGSRSGPPQEVNEFANFAQALSFLKKNYAFAELDFFSTEADLVYVSTGSRRILLSDDMPRRENTGYTEDSFLGATRSGEQRSEGRRDERQEHREVEGQEHGGAAGKLPGRFSGLEI